MAVALGSRQQQRERGDDAVGAGTAIKMISRQNSDLEAQNVGSSSLVRACWLSHKPGLDAPTWLRPLSVPHHLTHPPHPTLAKRTPARFENPPVAIIPMNTVLSAFVEDEDGADNTAQAGSSNSTDAFWISIKGGPASSKAFPVRALPRTGVGAGTGCSPYLPKHTRASARVPARHVRPPLTCCSLTRLVQCERQTYVQGEGGDFGCIVNTTDACNGVMHVFEGVALPTTDISVPPELDIKRVSAEAINSKYEEVRQGLVAGALGGLAGKGWG